MEGKAFALSEVDANRRAEELGSPHVVKIGIPIRFYQRLEHLSSDGRPMAYVGPDLLDELNLLALIDTPANHGEQIG